MKQENLGVSDEETELLLSDLFELYGYDFLDYSRASIKRRINRILIINKFPSFAELRYRLKSDADFLKHLVEELTVNVTEMFRDPSYFKTLREEVVPALMPHPLIRIWVAGCSTGEEAFSIAILLKEAGILHKSLIYATDLNPEVLKKAKKGILPLLNMKQNSANYIDSGGRHVFSDYYAAGYNKAKLDTELLEKIVFSTHNLVSDRSFNEFHLILCRNVLIYFNKNLQDRVLKLFDESLDQLGYLGLGSKETLKFSPVISKYKQISPEKIWRKIK